MRVEKGHQLHGDIEWYYKIHSNVGEREWLVDVYKMPFEGKPISIVKAMPVVEAHRKAKSIEDMGYSAQKRTRL